MNTAAQRDAAARVAAFCDHNGLPAPAPLAPPAINFPNATAEEWSAAQAIIGRLLARRGITGPEAEDAQQDWADRTLRTNYRQPVEGPVHAAYITAALVRRRGVGVLLRQRRNAAKRHKRTGQQEPQPMGEAVGIRDTAPASCNPATMAEAGEALAARMPKYAQAARARGMTPAALALAAAGWGPIDDEDVPPSAVTACGPGYTPPTRGCPGLHTATDPNPASRTAAVAACRAQLDALAAGAVQPRHQEQEPEPTAAEQAVQAQEAWQRFKARAAARD